MKKDNPFPHSNSNKRYYTYDYFLRGRFGEKCCKLPLDGGFTCPNRDGTKGVGGCTFCSARGSGDFAASPKKSISRQLQEMAAMLAHKWGVVKYIPYFQAFSATYAPVKVLRQLYTEALAFPGVVGLSIATRPDCLADDVVAYLRELHQTTYLTVELGLQTIHDETAKRLNRGHTYSDFLVAYEKLRGLNVCVHLINGLPGETESDMLETVEAVAALRPHAIKLHVLQILRYTALCDTYLQNPFPTFSMASYVDLVCRQLERLPPETVVARLSADSSATDLVAPPWVRNKRAFLNEVDKRMVALDTWQGKLYSDKKS